MIIDIDVSYSIQGEQLNPFEIENDLDIKFSKTEIKDSLGTIGRYKNKPLPYSSGVIQNNKYDESCDYSEINRIANIALKIKSKKEKYNIEYDSFFITFYYCAQCGLEFDKQQLSLFSELDGIAIDCVRLYDFAEFEAIDEISDKVRFYNNNILEKEIIMKFV